MAKFASTEFLKRLRPKRNRKSVAFFACLGLSSLFWLLTSLSKEYTEIVQIPITYQNLPEDMLVVNELSRHVNAEVKIIGLDLLWYWYQSDKTEIIINTDQLQKVIRKGQETHIFLTENQKNNISTALNEQFQLLSISPDTLFVQFKPLFIKMVPVKLNAQISYAKQYGMMDQPIIQPDSILVSGIEELVDTISFVTTELEVWEKLNESITATLPLKQFEPSQIIRLSKNEVEVELNVVEFTEGTVRIPVQIEAKNPENIKVFPQFVDITYLVPLEAYDNIQPEQFNVSVQLNESRLSDITRLTVNIDTYPDGIRHMRSNPSQVEFIIQK